MLLLASVSTPPKSLTEDIWKLERQSQCKPLLSHNSLNMTRKIYRRVSRKTYQFGCIKY